MFPWGMLVILFAGLGLWIYYGVLKNDLIIVVSNSFSFVINLLLAIFSLKYKEGNAAEILNGSSNPKAA